MKSEKMGNTVYQTNKKIIVLIVLIIIGLSFKTLFAQVNQRTNNQNKTPGEYYNEMQRKLASGWNTWNTRSVLSQVLLPEYFAINFQLQDLKSGTVLKEALIGRRGVDVEKVTPGPHAYNGSYTELSVDWKDINVNVKTASDSKNIAIIFSPDKSKNSGVLLIKPTMIWGGKVKWKLKVTGLYFAVTTKN